MVLIFDVSAAELVDPRVGASDPRIAMPDIAVGALSTRVPSKELTVAMVRGFLLC
jgi:hypothetical protein